MISNQQLLPQLWLILLVEVNCGMYIIIVIANQQNGVSISLPNVNVGDQMDGIHNIF